MAQNNPFFGNPLDKVTDEIRAQRYELPDFSEVNPDVDAAGTSPGGSDGLLPPPEYEPLFVNASTQYQVPLNVLMALGQQESSYNPGAIGPMTKWGKAKGMMQYIDPTAEGMGIDPLDPAQAVEAAAIQFRERLDKGYSVEEAIMAHHGGDNREQWGPKTRQYLRDVLGKAGAIREQWQPTQRPEGVTSTAIKAAEAVAPRAPKSAAEGLPQGDMGKAPGNAAAREQLGALREQAQDPSQVDAMTGADIKTQDPNAPTGGTPLDLIRQGLDSVNDVLQTPASEIDFLNRTPEGPSGEEKPKGGLLGDITGNIEAATGDPSEFTGERARDEAPDAFTGADIKTPNTDWQGWVTNLAKEVTSGALGSTGSSVEGTGLIGQQLANVEAGRQLSQAARKFDGARQALAQTLEANKDQDPQTALKRAQAQADNVTEAEIAFHQALVEEAKRDPGKIAGWLREKGVDIGKLAQELKADPEYQGVATDLAAGVGSMLTYLGPGFVTTLMTRGSTAAVRGIAGIAGASALAGPAGAAEAYQRAKEYGLPEEEAVRISMQGIPAGVVQVAPVATILKKIPEGIRGKAVAQFRHLLESFGAEFTAEGAGAVLQNLVEKSYNKDKGVWDDSLYQAAIGGSSAALISLGVQLATRGKGIGPLDAGDLGAELQKNIKQRDWASSPEMEALRVMDPEAYLGNIREQVEAAAGPEAILAGDIMQPEGPAPEGSIERAAVETVGEEKVAQVPGERVTVETRTGKITGTVEDYYEDGQGNFQAQVLSDDGEVYVFDQDSQAVILRDEMLGEDQDNENESRREGDDATAGAGPAAVPPMANVEAGESPGEPDRPEGGGDGASAADDTPAATEQLDPGYGERATYRETALAEAQSEQDVQDIIDAEIEDKPGFGTQRRKDVIAAAEKRSEEIQKEQRQKREKDAEALHNQSRQTLAEQAPEGVRPRVAEIEAEVARLRKLADKQHIASAVRTTEEISQLLEEANALIEGREPRIREQPAEAEQETAPTGEPVVEHVTRKGKTKRGVVRDVPKAEATAIDPYTFKKDGGWFINLSRLPEEQQGKPIEAPGPDTENEQTVTQDTEAKPLEVKSDGNPFTSYETAARAAKNRNITGTPVQVEGGWAIQKGEATPTQEQAPDTAAITRENAEAQLAPARWRGDQAKTAQYVNALMERGLIEGSPQLSSARDAGDYQAMADEIDRQLAGEAVRPATVDTVESPGSAAKRQRARNDDGRIGTNSDGTGKFAGPAMEKNVTAGRQAFANNQPRRVPDSVRRESSDSAKAWYAGYDAAQQEDQASTPPPANPSPSADAGSDEYLARTRERRDRLVEADSVDEINAIVAEEWADAERTSPSFFAMQTAATSRWQELYSQSEGGIAPRRKYEDRQAKAKPQAKKPDRTPPNADAQKQAEADEVGSVDFSAMGTVREQVDAWLSMEGGERLIDYRGNDRGVVESVKGRVVTLRDNDGSRNKLNISAVTGGGSGIVASLESRQAKPKASENTVFTEDAAEKARALLKSKLGQINSGLDPEMFQAGITLAGYHVERGARSFAAYARAMVDDLGEAVKPHLKQFYMGLKYDPRATGFEGMDAAADVDAADVDAVLAETAEEGDTLSEPMTLYHGTAAGNRFDTFDRGRANTGVGVNSRDQGDQAYYTTRPDAAAWFAGRAEQNRQLNAATGPVGDLSDVAGEVLPFTLKAGSRVLRRDDMPRGAAAQSVIDKARRDGYDAIVFPDQGFMTVEGDPAVSAMIQEGIPDTVIVLNDGAMEAQAQEAAETTELEGAQVTPEVFAELMADAEAVEDPRSPFVTPPKITRAGDVAKRNGEMSLEDAQDRVERWKAHARAQGESGVNSGKVVLSLFEVSGELTRPWVDAGYDVQTFDIQTGTDIAEFDVERLMEEVEGGLENVHAVLACPPCTHFSNAANRLYAEKDADGRTDQAKQLVQQVLNTVELVRPPIWMIENPVGRMARVMGMPHPTFNFHPHHFGDPFTKKTLLWGDFNPNLPQANVDPTEGSKTAKQSGKDKDARSETPTGFAYAFFMANNAADMAPADLLARQFRGMDPALFEQAIDAGLTPERIRSLIEDDYNDVALEAAESVLRDATRMQAPEYQAERQRLQERQEEVSAAAKAGDARTQAWADLQFEYVESQKREQEEKARDERPVPEMPDNVGDRAWRFAGIVQSGGYSQREIAVLASTIHKGSGEVTTDDVRNAAALARGENPFGPGIDLDAPFRKAGIMSPSRVRELTGAFEPPANTDVAPPEPAPAPEPVDMTRPTDEVLRPDGQQPRWRTENAATKYRDKRDLLGIYAPEAEGKGFILRRLPTFTLTVSEHRYHSQSVGAEVGNTVLLRPEGMDSDLFQALVAEKLRVKPSQIIQNGTMVKAPVDKIQRLADHLEAPVVDHRDPEASLQAPIRGGSRDDTQGDPAAGTQPLVDTAPESTVPAEPGADPERVDGVRPSRETGDGQPESDRTRRGDGLERGEVAGTPGTADTGGSGTGDAAAGPGGGHRAPASDSLNRGEDRPHTLAGENPGNFVIPDDFKLGQGSDGTKIKDNLAALEVMLAANAENRFATPDEQKILARYVGWGGLGQVFDPKHRGKTNQYGRAHAWLKEHLTKEQFAAAKRSIQDAHYTSDQVVGMMWKAARHFGFKGGRALEPTVGTGNFLGLEPADLAGATEWHAAELDDVSGRIAQLLYPEANVLAATGFQDAPFADGVMDLAIGNPPFGQQPIRDRSKRRGHLDGMKIHNYIIAKAGMHLRPGGVMQMVVTHRFLDTADPEGRRELAKHFRLLGAVRLPNNAFAENAGTEVTTDMVYLQKLREGEAPDTDAAWLDTSGEIEVDGVTMRVNRYFQEHPENILGKSSMAGSMYQGQGKEYTVESDGRDIAAAFDKLLSEGSLAGLTNVMEQTAIDRDGQAVMLEQSELPVGGMTLTPEGTIIQRDLDDAAGNSVINEVTPESYWKEKAAQWGDAIDAVKAIKAAREAGRPVSPEMLKDLEEAAQVATNADGGKKPKPTKAEQALYDVMDAAVNPNMAWAFDEGLAAMEATLQRKQLGRKGYDTLRKLLDLRGKTLKLLHAERTDAADMEARRRELNQAYDAFVKAYGLISDPSNLSLLAGDVGVEVGLETSYQPAIKPAEAKAMGTEPQKASAKKADILQRRVTWPDKVIDHADNALDGMSISLSEKGKLDLAYIAELTGKPEGEVINELQSEEAIFYDADVMDFVTADEYLSGNVKNKLQVAIANSQDDNVAALEKVQPEPKTQEQVTPSVRGTWLPASLFEEFLGALGLKSPRVLVQPTIGRISAREAYGEATELGLQFTDPDVSIVQLFNAASSGKSLKVLRKDSDGNSFEDKGASQRVTAKAERMAQVFKEWAYSEADRAQAVVDAYNRVMNTHRQRAYNGEKYLKTVGQSPSVKLRRTQKNAAWRMIQSNAVLTDHVVGAGKTFTLITGIMERRRLGLSRKPAIVVPNHLVVQWASEFYQLYPGARILAATPDDFSKKNRRRLFARIATGDYDAIIMGHSSFGFIQPPEADVRDVIAENKAKLEFAMEEARQAGESGRSLKQMQKKLDTYDDRLRALAERERDEMGVDFEAMGIDYLAVDEAHMFKNLEYATSGERVVGMNDPKGSSRAFDLYTKLRGLQKRGGGTTFATGTPVSNSLVELYTMMRYLAPDALKARDQDHFDAWAGAYAVTETRMEYTATQKLKPRRVLSGLANLDGLGQLYREFADIITMDDLKRIYSEEKREANKANGTDERTEFPVPKVKHGGRQLDTGEITQQQSEYMDYLVARMQAIEENKRDPEYARIDNPLWVLSDARKMSLDIRVVDPTAQRDADGKVMRSARKIKDLYDRWDADRGTQMVFSDLSTPAKTSGGAARKIVTDGLKVVFGEAEAKRVKKRLKDMSMREQWKYVQQAAERVMEDPAIAGEKVAKIEEYLEANAFADSTMLVADTGFSAYDDLKQVLTEMGIPSHEIAFIHDYNTPDQKSRLFARVNAGSIRVLIGSTEKMGAGTNAQERLVGLHHLDAPWRPSDVEQREGRIIRQGNKLYERDPDGFEVEITAYSTNGTSDTVMWQVLERKAAAIEQFRQAGLDAMQEDGADSDQYAEFMAASTGNPVFKLKLEAERDLNNTQAEVGGKLIAVQNARSFMERYPERVESLTKRRDALAAMEVGDIVVGDQTGSLEDMRKTWDAAHEKFLADYAAWETRSAEVEKEREVAAAAGKRMPGMPSAPTMPTLMDGVITQQSGYARAIKAALEAVQEGAKDQGRIIPVRVGNIDLEVERRIRGNGNVAYLVNLKFPGGAISNIAVSEAKNPVDAPTLVTALTPKRIKEMIGIEARSVEYGLRDVEGRVERESKLAKEEVSEQPITDAQVLLDWYKDQVKIAEYEADIKRGERQNRYIAADRSRPIGQFKARGEVEAKQFTVGGETFTTTGLAAVEGGGRLTIHDATRDRDGAKALVYEQKEGQDAEPIISAVLEPAEARKQRRSATAQSNARKRRPRERMSALEVDQRIRQGRYGDAAGKLLDSGKVRITDTTPGDVPNSTAAYVDEQGVIHLVARNLDPRYAEATLLHEAFHAGARPLIGNARWNELTERLGKLYRQAERSRGRNRQFWEAAHARIAAAEAAGDVMDDARRVEEFGAYALEEFANAPSTLRQWASEMAGRVKAWLQRTFGIQAGEVTPAQLRALAAAALRNGDMAPSPSLALNTDTLVDRDGNPVPERERKAELNKAVRKARKALSVVQQDGVNDRDGGVVRDILKPTALLTQPYTIASMEPEFTPVFRTAMAQMRFRDTIISEMYPRFQAYKELRADSRAKVNKVLELGRLSGLSYSDARLKAGIENRGYKTVVSYDPLGLPMRRQEPLNAALTQPGEVTKLTQEEIAAYRELRTMFDEALDLFRDQTLIDMDMAEFVGSKDPVAEILAAIDGEMSDAKKERYRNIAKMAEEIDQAKRTGYVPLARYGRFVITVKEKIAKVKYAKNPEGGFIARGVPDTLADFMRDIGATWNDLEGGWQVSDGQRRQLSRETTRTVYSEKLDPESYANRWETWRASKNGKRPDSLSFIKEAKARIEAEWGGEGRRVSVLDTKKARLGGGLKLSDIDSLADMAQVDPATWENIRDDFVKAMKGRGFRKHFFRADHVPGYEVDFERAIADYISGMAGYLSRRHHDKQWETAIGGVRGPNLNEYSKEYRDYVNNPAEEHATLRQVGFLYYIAGNVSTALLNATQVPIMTMPALSQVMSSAKAAKHVTGAYKDALAMTSLYDQAREGYQRGGVAGAADNMLQMFDPNDAPEDVRAEVLAAWEDGMFSPQFTHEVMGFSNRRDGSAQAKLEKTIDYVASSYTYIERLNRLVTFIAAVRAAKDPKVRAQVETSLKGNHLARATLFGDNWSPKAFGEFIVDESQFLMGKVNRATILRSHGAAIFQFMSFVINSLQAWYRWSAVNGRSGKFATAYSIGAIVALSGVWGAPGMEYLRAAIEKLWLELTGEDEDLRYHLREWVGDKSWDFVGEIVDKGAFYPLGADMSGRIGFMRMLPDMTDPISMFGIPADLLIGRPMRATNAALSGNYGGAVAELSPNFLKNPITAREWSKKGVVSRSGNQAITPEQMPTHAYWYKALGIQPSIVSDAWEYKFAKSRMQRATSDAKTRIVNKIARAEADAARNEDPGRQAELEARVDRYYQDAYEFNDDNPDDWLDPRTLQRRVRNKVNEYLYGFDQMGPVPSPDVDRAMEVYNVDEMFDRGRENER